LLDGGNVAICYAAHEKIASDLAFKLLLPVPPVLLWDRSDATATQHRWCCISGWAFDGARKFQELGGNVPIDHRGRAQEALSAMVAFDTWIGAEDRNDGNLIIDGNYCSEVPVACVDYSWSLSKQWTKGHYPRSVIDPYTGRFGGRLTDHTRAMADRIRDLDPNAIETIVSAIPVDFLSAEKAEVVVLGLKDGQRTIHTLLGL
jgi:hypothetical protein